MTFVSAVSHSGGDPAGRLRGPRFASIQTASYSGATLLCFLLGTHPQVATIGEVDGLIPAEDPDQYRCSCGQRIRACPFWLAVGEAMRKGGEPFDVASFATKFNLAGPRVLHALRAGSFGHPAVNVSRDRLFQRLPGEGARWRRLVRRNEIFIRSVLAVSGKEVLVDSSKDALRLSAVRDLSDMPVVAIHLVRDVRGVVASRLRRGVPVSAAEAARQWVNLNKRIEVNLRSLPAAAVVRVRYEDVCADLNGTLARLHAHLGVPPQEPVEDFRSTPHHIIGNTMRLTDRTAIELDDSWRQLLSDEQIAAIDRVAGTLRQRFGYT